jgi:hypothetical protein
MTRLQPSAADKVAKTLHSGTPDEIFVFGAIYIDVTPESYPFAVYYGADYFGWNFFPEWPIPLIPELLSNLADSAHSLTTTGLSSRPRSIESMTSSMVPPFRPSI